MKNHSLDKPNPTSRLNATPRPEAVPGAGGISRWVQRLPGAGWLSHFLARRGPNTALASGAATDRAGDLHTSESGFPPSGPFIAGDVPPSEKELAERLLKYVRSRKNAHDGWILFDHLDHATKVNRMFFSLFGLKEEDVRGCSPEEVLATISLACDLEGEFPQISYLSMGIFNKPTPHRNYSCVFKITLPEKRLMQVVRCELSSVKYGSLLLFTDVSDLPIVEVMMAQSLPGLNDFQKTRPMSYAGEGHSNHHGIAKTNQTTGYRRPVARMTAEERGS